MGIAISFAAIADDTRSVSGHLTIDGKPQAIIDILAVPNAFGAEIYASTAAFDWERFAEDGVLDGSDTIIIASSETPVLRLTVDANGSPLFCVKLRRGFDRSEFCDDIQLALSTTSKTRLAGTLAARSESGNSLQIKFDVPVQSTLTPVVRGTAFAGDGHAAAKAFLAYTTALASAEAAKLLPVLPPEARQQLESMSDQDRAKRIGMMRTMAPQDATISGGSVDGDRAFIDFTGRSESGAMSGKAEMRRIDGRWFLKSIRSKG